MAVAVGGLDGVMFGLARVYHMVSAKTFPLPFQARFARMTYADR